MRELLNTSKQANVEVYSFENSNKRAVDIQININIKFEN
jgi:hypothetical protein